MNYRSLSEAHLFAPLGLLLSFIAAGCTFDTAGVGTNTNSNSNSTAVCGDEVVNGDEACDTSDLAGASCASLGFGTGTLACASNCDFNISGCSDPPVCGDGTTDPGETCDDGNTTACDGCSATCHQEGCGNGTLECTEECDDGNTVADDGCSPICEIETPPGCGDGNVDGNEECDDGNTIACDGCSPACLVEECGNGTVECNEECDVGDIADCDGCSAACLLEECGNGTVDCGEECDVGDTADCDGCSAACQLEECGNGTVDCGEVCEDGQVVSDCVNEGFGGGTLGCNGTCTGYDTSACLLATGQACTSDSQCVGNICFDEITYGMPAGYCSSDCSSLPCLNGNVCTQLNDGRQRCYPPCTVSTDCRPEYYCRIDPYSTDLLVCRPMCTSDADCPDTGNCNVYTRYCRVDSSNTLGDTGAGCTSSGQCRGHCMIEQPNGEPPNGYCFTECNTSASASNPVCPGDGVCLSTLSPSDGDLGFCLDGCQGNPDCTRGLYDCRSTSNGNICWFE